MNGYREDHASVQKTGGTTARTLRRETAAATAVGPRFRQTRAAHEQAPMRALRKTRPGQKRNFKNRAGAGSLPLLLGGVF
jgi:hypothetical protein